GAGPRRRRAGVPRVLWRPPGLRGVHVAGRGVLRGAGAPYRAPWQGESAVAGRERRLRAPVRSWPTALSRGGATVRARTAVRTVADRAEAPAHTARIAKSVDKGRHPPYLSRSVAAVPAAARNHQTGGSTMSRTQLHDEVRGRPR